MKFECRKCKLIFDAITWEDVEELQNKKCGRYGKHRILESAYLVLSTMSCNYCNGSKR